MNGAESNLPLAEMPGQPEEMFATILEVSEELGMREPVETLMYSLQSNIAFKYENGLTTVSQEQLMYEFYTLVLACLLALKYIQDGLDSPRSKLKDFATILKGYFNISTEAATNIGRMLVDSPQFISIVDHDAKRPGTIIIGTVSLTAQGFASEEEAASDFGNFKTYCLDLMNWVVNLTTAKPVPLNEILDEHVVGRANVISERNVEIYDPKLLAAIHTLVMNSATAIGGLADRTIQISTGSPTIQNPDIANNLPIPAEFTTVRIANRFNPNDREKIIQKLRSYLDPQRENEGHGLENAIQLFPMQIKLEDDIFTLEFQVPKFAVITPLAE